MNLIEKLSLKNAVALDEMLQKHAVPDDWKISVINGMWQHSSVGFTHKDLRTAIADHDEGDRWIKDIKSFNQWMADQGFNALRHANCCRIAYEGGQQSMQTKIDQLKAQLNNMEQCYIGMKKERDDLQERVNSTVGVCTENRLCIGKFMIECETLALIDEVEKALRGASDQHLPR